MNAETPPMHECTFFFTAMRYQLERCRSAMGITRSRFASVSRTAHERFANPYEIFKNWVPEGLYQPLGRNASLYMSKTTNYELPITDLASRTVRE